MSSSEQDEAKARLDALKRSLDSKRKREQAEHARVNDAFLLHTSPRAISVTGASVVALLAAVVFALVAVGTGSAWWALPSALLGLIGVGGFVAAGVRSRQGGRS